MNISRKMITIRVPSVLLNAIDHTAIRQGKRRTELILESIRCRLNQYGVRLDPNNNVKFTPIPEPGGMVYRHGHRVH